MRKHLVPHTAKWVAVCLACVYGSLIFQGCGGDDPAPEANPYAALEEAFPEGMPGLDDVDVRAQDKAYLEEMAAEVEKKSLLSKQLAEQEATLKHIREEVAKGMRLQMGEKVPEALLEDELSKLPLYREAVAKREALLAEAEAHRLAVMEKVRTRMTASQRKFLEMKAEADAKAKEAKLPVRTVEPPKPTAPVAAESAGEKAAPTLNDLVKETGIPVAPAAGNPAR